MANKTEGWMKTKRRGIEGLEVEGYRSRGPPQDCRSHWGWDIFSSYFSLISPNAECLLVLYLGCYTTKDCIICQWSLVCQNFLCCLIFIFPSVAPSASRQTEVEVEVCN